MVTVEAIAELNRLAERDIKEVITPEGFLAAAKDQHFGVFFGRDAAIQSLFTLEKFKRTPNGSEILIPVKNSLVTMAAYQGKEINFEKEEEPGKIIHELRHGDGIEANQSWLRNLRGKFPVGVNEDGHLYMEYYGSVDSTPLFITVACEYLTISGDREFFKFLDPYIRRAIEWMSKYGDRDGDGYIEYEAKNLKALKNQGWKDSDNSIRAMGPIALVEVQGYQYLAYTKASQLYEQEDPLYSKRLSEKARFLKKQFNRDFWMDDEKFFAHALAGDKTKVKDLVSNAGHLLMTGIVDQEKRSLVVNRLMRPDMLTPYGIRTLSSNSLNFSDVEPQAYHNGSVWPHDNAIIYLGLNGLGFAKEAGIVREAFLEAQYILNTQYGVGNSELHIVDRDNRLRPYETACHPQGWVAEATSMLVADLLEVNQIIESLRT